MLADYSLHRFKAEVRPTAEDLVFLFRCFGLILGCGEMSPCPNGKKPAMPYLRPV